MSSVDLLFIKSSIVWWVIGGIPTFFILRKAGKSLWWGVLVAIPMLGFVILLWILAFSRWPARMPQTEAPALIR